MHPCAATLRGSEAGARKAMQWVRLGLESGRPAPTGTKCGGKGQYFKEQIAEVASREAGPGRDPQIKEGGELED